MGGFCLECEICSKFLEASYVGCYKICLYDNKSPLTLCCNNDGWPKPTNEDIITATELLGWGDFTVKNRKTDSEYVLTYSEILYLMQVVFCEIVRWIIRMNVSDTRKLDQTEGALVPWNILPPFVFTSSIFE